MRESLREWMELSSQMDTSIGGKRSKRSVRGNSYSSQRGKRRREYIKVVNEYFKKAE